MPRHREIIGCGIPSMLFLVGSDLFIADGCFHCLWASVLSVTVHDCCCQKLLWDHCPRYLTQDAKNAHNSSSVCVVFEAWISMCTHKYQFVNFSVFICFLWETPAQFETHIRSLHEMDMEQTSCMVSPLKYGKASTNESRKAHPPLIILRKTLCKQSVCAITYSCHSRVIHLAWK